MATSTYPQLNKSFQQQPMSQQNDTFLHYQSILDENERLRIENAILNQKRTVRQQQKCPKCDELEQKIKDLQVEYDLLKGKYDELEKRIQIQSDKEEDQQVGPDRNQMVDRLRSGDRMGSPSGMTVKKQPSRGRFSRGLARGFE